MSRLALLFVVAICALAVSAESRRPYAGRPLVEVIAELQQRGLTIIYSTDLVKPAMHVVDEPHATVDRELLEEILAPHSLAVKETSSGVLSIVRGDRRPRNTSAASKILPAADAVSAVTLGSIVVTASNYSVLGSSPEHRDFLTRQEINRTAHLGDDLFRALSQLPGAASTDYSAAFQVRGELPEETLVVVDGLAIADPFHIKYFQNAISIIDSEAIGSLDFLSGGAPVEYGNAMGGVIDMSTASPQAQRHTSAGLSFTHARLVTDGMFDGDRGHWLVSARRGYFDLLLGIFYSDVTARPRYGDVIAKIDERISARSMLSANVLTATDRIDYSDTGDRIKASYDNAYGWLNLRTSWSPQLSSQSVASWSRLRQRKSGYLDIPSEFGNVNDRRSFDIAGLKQDWTFDRSDLRQFVKAGADFKHFRTRYDYAMQAVTINPLLFVGGNPAERSRAIAMTPSGTSLAFYAADRVRVLPAVAIEAGARFERESWHTGDAAITPRVNLVWTPTSMTAVRAAWGEFRQAQRLDDISVEDGETATYTAQRSRQAEVGLEQHLGRGFLLRGTVYRRNVSNVRPRYENLFDRDELFPEVKYDRQRIAPDSSHASGVELLLKDESTRPLTWWVSVAHSRVADRFGAIEQPRSWDQPNAISFNANYRRGSTWNFNFAGLFHTGWPATTLSGAYDATRAPIPAVLQLGPRNGDRLPAYRRLDARAMRSVAFSRGVFRSWLEVTNLLNHPNPCCVGNFNIDIEPSRRTVDITPHASGLGWLPSFGIVWEF